MVIGAMVALVLDFWPGLAVIATIGAASSIGRADLRAHLAKPDVPWSVLGWVEAWKADETVLVLSYMAGAIGAMIGVWLGLR